MMASQKMFYKTRTVIVRRYSPKASVCFRKPVALEFASLIMVKGEIMLIFTMF